jgi:hypothetical protein
VGPGGTADRAAQHRHHWHRAAGPDWPILVGGGRRWRDRSHRRAIGPAVTAVVVPALAQIGSTALYRAGGPETFVFLRWSPPDEPTLPLDETWAARGSPPAVGYYVFLLAVPGATDAVALETALRAALPEPRATGIVWARFTPPSALDVVGELVVLLDVDDVPVVAADTTVRFPPGMPEFSFVPGMAVVGRGGPSLDALAVVPRRGLLRKPAASAPGVTVPLLGGLSGCLSFDALQESIVVGYQSNKALAAVLLDPLRPYDNQRTSITPLGQAYAFSVNADGVHHLAPIPGRF